MVSAESMRRRDTAVHRQITIGLGKEDDERSHGDYRGCRDSDPAHFHSHPSGGQSGAEWCRRKPFLRSPNASAIPAANATQERPNGRPIFWGSSGQLLAQPGATRAQSRTPYRDHNHNRSQQHEHRSRIEGLFEGSQSMSCGPKGRALSSTIGREMLAAASGHHSVRSQRTDRVLRSPCLSLVSL